MRCFRMSGLGRRRRLLLIISPASASTTRASPASPMGSGLLLLRRHFLRCLNWLLGSDLPLGGDRFFLLAPLFLFLLGFRLVDGLLALLRGR